MFRFQNKYIQFLLLCMIGLLILSACGKSAEKDATREGKVLVYTTIFPLYDFSREIGGDFVEVKSIIPPGAEPHDFEPTPRQMIELAQADIFVYNGAGFEMWIEKAIQNLDPKKTIVVNGSEGLELILDDHGHDHDHDGEDGHDHDDDYADEEGHDNDDHHHGQYDPHVWLNPMNAKSQGEKILVALVEVAPEYKEAFQANFDRLANQLGELDQLYAETFKQATKKELIVSHQAFGYLANRYDFEQIPVSGLSPEVEPSSKAIIELIEVLHAHDLKYIAYDAFFENKVAQTIQRETGAEAVLLYNLENVSKEQLEEGKTYIDLMMENLEVFKKVLEVK